MRNNKNNTPNGNGPRSPEHRSVTILRADIADSSTIVMSMTPDDAADFLDPVIEEMAQAVHAFGGKILRIMGDGITAVFGIENQQEDHPLRGVLAANRMFQALKSRPSNAAGPTPAVRVGIHTGYVILRWQDSDFGGNLDTVGSAVHIAAKIEAAADPNIITMSGTTASLIEKHLETCQKPGDPIFGEDIHWVEPRENLQLQTHITSKKPAIAIIGRDHELATINKVLFSQASTSSTAPHIYLMGNAGIGKSRLIEEIVRLAELKNHRVHVVGGMPIFKDTPYSLVKRLVRRLLRLSPTFSAGEDLSEIETISSKGSMQSALRFLIGAPSESNPVSKSNSWFAALVSAITLLIQKILDANALLLVIEDMHAVDAESRAILEQVVPKLRHTNCKLVFTSRPYAQSQYQNLFGQQLDLRPLSPEDSQLLAEMIFKDTVANPDQQLENVLTRSEGLPLAIIEFAKMANRSNGDQLADTMPLALEPLLRQRIDRLTEPTQKLVHMASVIGTQIRLDLLTAFFDRSADLETALTEAADEGILHWQDQNRLKFEHQLFQEACYSGLTRDQRKSMHGQVYDNVKSAPSYQEDPQFLAYHAEHAEFYEEALELLWRACKRASSRGAIGTLRSLYYRASNICDRIGTEEASLQKIKFASRAYMAFQQLAFEQELVPLFEDGLRRNSVGQDPLLKAIILCNLSSAKWLDGAPDSEGLAAEACEITSQFKNPVIEAQAQFQLANSEFQSGKIRKASERLLGVSDDILNPAPGQEFAGSFFLPSCQYRVFASWYLVELGEFERAKSLHDEARAIATKLNHTHSQINCDLSLGYQLLRQEKFSDAATALSDTYARCIENSHTGISSLVAAWSCLALAECGEIDKARDILTIELDRGLYARRRNCWAIYIELAQAKIYEKKNEVEKALIHAKRALEIAQNSVDPVHEAYSRIEIWRLTQSNTLVDSAFHLEYAYKLSELCAMIPLMNKIKSLADETDFGASHGFEFKNSAKII